jgi:hypothetical protein
MIDLESGKRKHEPLAALQGGHSQQDENKNYVGKGRTLLTWSSIVTNIET